MRTVATLLLLIAAGPLLADEPVSYSRDVRPILTSTCFKCHGPDLKKGGLDLQRHETAIVELKSGEKAVVPGQSAKSELLRRVNLPADETEHMPPKGQLTAVQIATLKRWIDQGAKYEEHWAFLPPRKAEVPHDPSWGRNRIDDYVLARLKREGLAPAKEADKATLIRRLSFDLTGLPPTPRDVDQFLNDKSPDAYGKLVDRLLASPHYGEHMARMWLDLARYADTNGYEKDERRNIWPFRDWVIEAFNRDLPYDRFTQEQLGGDLIPNATRDQIVATGFHRNTMTNTEGGTDDEEFRSAAVVDRVNATMETWMGLTFSCAQCHNHKYDPFSQKDYYQVYAVFNSTTDGGRSVAPEIPLPTEQDQSKLRALRSQRQHAEVVAAVVSAGAIQPRLTAIKKQEDAVGNTKKTLVLKELAKPRETHIHLRGEFRNLGEQVAPGIPSKFEQSAAAAARLNRLEFAKWLVNKENPLAGRVMMNRLWARIFGRGIVETLEDFGVQGEPPTHPELLDWLAVEFAERNWSIKQMMKVIVTSATYRQETTVTPEKRERDPFNRLFSRGPRFRLDAEMVRDNALAVSGLLHRKLGGPSVFPYQPDGVWANPYSGDRWQVSANGDQYRRGLYTFWRRTAPFAMFTSFDAPSREVACSRRPRTNTPLQALATLNDRSFVEMSNALARRVLTESGSTAEERLTFAFRCCVARPPRERERQVLLELLERNRRSYAFRSEAAKKLAGTGVKGTPSFELAAWTVVANVLLNLDETVTKE